MVVMCYNVENLFDCRDDTLKDDAEFLPTSVRAWHIGRFKRKMANLSRAIINSGHGSIPALVALCEVENDYVMRYLTRYSPLKQLGYRYVVTDSPDERGIDVALIYQRERFRLLSSCPVTVDVSAAGAPPTRDLLHCSGLVATGDTLDIIVCHLPSRRGGTGSASRARSIVMRRMRQYADSLLAVRSSPAVMMMGDFNTDAADDELWRLMNDSHYCLLTAHYSDSVEVGSYKYRQVWQTIDHIVVNRAMSDGRARLRARRAGVVADAYLLEDDARYLGRRPRRTYHGMRYAGGGRGLSLASDAMRQNIVCQQS